MSSGRGFRPTGLDRRRSGGVLLRRFWATLKRQRSILTLLVIVDAALAVAVGLWTHSFTLLLLALLPLLLAPALAALAYWLLWHDFHR